MELSVIDEFLSILHDVYLYVNNFENPLDYVSDNENFKYKFVISTDNRLSATHPKRISHQQGSHVIGRPQEFDKRDIVLRVHDYYLQMNSETRCSYGAVLMFYL